MKVLRLLLLIAATMVLPRAFALDAAEEKTERDRIKSERAQAEAAYAQRERDCRTRFVVTSCIDEARRDRRRALEQLRLQQEVLDEQQRKQRAAQRMDEIRNKVSGDDVKRREADTAGRRKEKPRADVPSRSASAAAAASALASSAEPSHQAPKDEAKNAAEYDKRQREAQEHREAVAKRNAERAAKGKPPAKPLPLPPGASAASATTR